jgi:hypothetical protein
LIASSTDFYNRIGLTTEVIEVLPEALKLGFRHINTAHLHRLHPNVDLVIWLAHLSYYVQLGGKRIPTDPVFSIDAALVPFASCHL